MNDQSILKTRRIVVTAACCAVASLSVWALSGREGYGNAATATDPESLECASLARAVANRNHSMMEGTAARATVNQAYQICMTDPAAFRRILR
jgi:hypothetical protein